MIRKKKDGKLIASWKGEVIIKAGGYYKKGLKQELWNELFEDHFNQPQIFYTGEYSKDFKIGRWKYFSKIRLCFQFNNYLEMMVSTKMNVGRQVSESSQIKWLTRFPTSYTQRTLNTFKILVNKRHVL